MVVSFKSAASEDVPTGGSGKTARAARGDGSCVADAEDCSGAARSNVMDNGRG